jgi:hypothetical protein
MAIVWLLPRDTPAQGPGRLELAAGGEWTGPLSLGDSPANARRANGGDFLLFDTDTELRAGRTVTGRVGVMLAGPLQLGVAAAYGTASLTTTVTSDVEIPQDVSVRESVRHLSIEGGLAMYLAGEPHARRFAPFVSGGAGYLRELHEGRTLIETGRIYYAGAGASFLLSQGASPRAIKAFGVRVEGRGQWRQRGIAFDADALSVVPALRGDVFVRF